MAVFPCSLSTWQAEAGGPSLYSSFQASQGYISELVSEEVIQAG